MESLVKFQAKFSDRLSCLKNEKQEAIKVFSETLREDEARFVRIELNILEIFEKMFGLSIAKWQSNDAWASNLKETYLNFFDKIPSAWHENLAKCESHGVFDEAHIERLKIAQAQVIENMFKDEIAN